MKLKVYRWQTAITREEQTALGLKPWITQVAANLAVPSKAAAARAAGQPRVNAFMFNFGETGNAQDIEAAMSEPGTIFLHSMEGGGRRYQYVKRERKGSSCRAVDR